MYLECEIRKKYSSFLLDIAFKTDSKRIGILGASGSGKSLTLKALAGLMQPDSGRIVLEGRILFDKKEKKDLKPKKRGVGYLFQDYALFPDMTVKENIKAALHGRKTSGRQAGKDEDIDEILNKYDLYSLKDRYPRELSGGEKQMTALSRMLENSPDLLLLDEPFSSMDSHLREGMRLKLMKYLEEFGRPFILVSHDRDEIYQLCDYLILIEKGAVIRQDQTEKVFSDPKTVSGARLTGCKNISRIERTGDHRVRALDWGGLELVTKDRVGEDISHIGIRAHDLFPADSGENLIPCKAPLVSRLPFEWLVTFDNGLWWKTKRDLGSDEKSVEIPGYLRVLPEKILLLSS